VTIGLEHVAEVGIESIHERVRDLAGWVLEEFAALLHSDGAPLIKIFGPPEMDRRGSTIAFYLLDRDGRPYDVYDVEAAAGTQLISLRSGCFCNPGDGEVAHGITHEDMKQCFEQIDRDAVNLKHCQLMIQDATGKVPNTLRVSLGIVSDFADVYRLLGFCAGYRDRPATDPRAVTRTGGPAVEARPHRPGEAGPSSAHPVGVGSGDVRSTALAAHDERRPGHDRDCTNDELPSEGLAEEGHTEQGGP
jgi:hypothetical protein